MAAVSHQSSDPALESPSALQLKANRADVSGMVDLGVVEDRDPHIGSSGNRNIGSRGCEFARYFERPVTASPARHALHVSPLIDIVDQDQGTRDDGPDWDFGVKLR